MDAERDFKRKTVGEGSKVQLPSVKTLPPMNNKSRTEESDVYGLGAKAQAASTAGLGRAGLATAKTQASDSYGGVSYDAKTITFQQRREQETQGKRDILSSMKTLQRQTKGFHAQSLPLFISADYANILENTKF